MLRYCMRRESLEKMSDIRTELKNFFVQKGGTFSEFFTFEGRDFSDHIPG